MIRADRRLRHSKNFRFETRFSYFVLLPTLFLTYYLRLGNIYFLLLLRMLKVLDGPQKHPGQETLVLPLLCQAGHFPEFLSLLRR